MHRIFEVGGQSVLSQDLGRIWIAQNRRALGRSREPARYAYSGIVGKHAISIACLAYPRKEELRLDDIAGVHPTVLTMLKRFPAERIVGLRGASEAFINNIYEIPFISVVPIPRRKHVLVLGRSYLGSVAHGIRNSRWAGPHSS